MAKRVLHTEVWEAFRRDNWESAPLPAIAPQSEVFSVSRLWDAVKEACERFRKTGSTPGFIRWGAHGVLGPRDVETHGPLLPSADDVTPEAYDRRLSQLGHREFFFQLGDLARARGDLWDGIYEFASEMSTFTGVPSDRLYADVYVGRYGATPFGVHLDGASNFTFGLVGKKTLYLWEPSYYHAEMERASRSLSDFIPDAMTLPVGPGQLIYWPSRMWHVADSHGELTMTANIAFYNGPGAVKAARAAAKHVSRVLAETLEAAASRVTTAYTPPQRGVMDGHESLPEPLADLCRHFSNGRGEGLDALLREGVLAFWMAHLSSLGLGPRPAEEQRVCDDDDVIASDSRRRVFRHELGAGRLLVAAGGWSFVTADRPGVRAILDWCDADQRRTWRDLMQWATTIGMSVTEAEPLFYALLEYGALSCSRSTGPGSKPQARV
jgi:hypothetical protein